MAVNVSELVRAQLKKSSQVVARTNDGTNIVIGPASSGEAQEGAVGVVPSGLADVERYVPTVKQNLTIRAYAPSVTEAEELGREIHEDIHEVRRKAITQANGEEYLVHYISVTGGPSLVIGEFEDIWEILMTVEVMASTCEV